MSNAPKAFNPKHFLRELSNDIIHEFSSFVDRRGLVTLSLTNKYFRDLVNQNFPITPYLVLRNGLRYDGDYQCHWSWSAEAENEQYEPMPEAIVSYLPTNELLRFRVLDFHFGTSTVNPYSVMRPIKHLWQNCELRIKCSLGCFSKIGEDIGFGEEFAPLVRTCRKLRLYGQLGLTILGQLLQGNCTEIDIADRVYVPKLRLPVAEIVDFLFSSTDDFRRLRFHTEVTEIAKVMEVVTAFKEKFISATVPAKFMFSWTQTYYYLSCPATKVPTEDSFCIENRETKQFLQQIHVNAQNPEAESQIDTIILACTNNSTPFVYEKDLYWLTFSQPAQGNEFV
ncbi:hypothetical protein DdX_14314 [Ditylenchus destructor]|uniref:F-box domain-containing protein n=1 Tax=Ditylenchus destructor TaxID=166010 RepID=A0AAD4MSC1_9BILA|nr:hypothetical protein DdX_14314 [Ditylenchus destructor]